MKTPPLPKEYATGFIDGHLEGYQDGFSRAVRLIMSKSMKWTREDRALFNLTARQFFGKKRNAKLAS